MRSPFKSIIVGVDLKGVPSIISTSTTASGMKEDFQRAITSAQKEGIGLVLQYGPRNFAMPARRRKVPASKRKLRRAQKQKEPES